MVATPVVGGVSVVAAPVVRGASVVTAPVGGVILLL